MVRIYHSENDGYSFHDHEATVFRRRSMFGQGAGFVGADEFSIRIFTEENINVERGDYIYIGTSPRAEPDFAACMMITEITDDRRGTRPHWRLVCGGDHFG